MGRLRTGQSYAPRMFFRETTGIPEAREVHRELAAEAPTRRSRGSSAPCHLRAPGGPLALAMAAEVIRGGLTELAIWWSDHPEVPPERIVATATNTLWIGLERVSGGHAWRAWRSIGAGATPAPGLPGFGRSILPVALISSHGDQGDAAPRIHDEEG
jgi:hypothetical protein